MKQLVPLTFIAALVSALGISAAFADDSNLQDRLAIERAQNPAHALQASSMAVYSAGKGVGSHARETQHREHTFHLLSGPQGQVEGSYR